MADIVGRSGQYTLGSRSATRDVRLFIALAVPEHVTQRLVQEQQRLDALGLPFRWVRWDAMHLTLVFLGETDESQVPIIQAAIDAAVSMAPPLSLRAAGTGTFPLRGTPRVLWAGLAGDRPGLIALYTTLRAALKEREVTVGGHSYAPHITLGRLSSRVSPDAVGQVRRVDSYFTRNEEFGGWTADAIHLIHSDLTPDGARYTTLYTSALKG